MIDLAFVDIETTSLARPFSPTPGEVWEVGLIVRQADGTEVERQWFLPVTLARPRPPWDSSDLAAADDVDLPRDEERHTALGDARWARDLYDAVMS